MSEAKQSDSTAELGALPAHHPLRNKPLAEVRAEFRNRLGTKWTLVLPSYGIARSTYNSLAPFWRELNEWRLSPNTNSGTDHVV